MTPVQSKAMERRLGIHYHLGISIDQSYRRIKWVIYYLFKI